jgi:hypothetical protein
LSIASLLIHIHFSLGCRAIGFDVSPPCIAMAKQVALDEGLSEDQCSFYEVDATMDPDILLKGEFT